MPKKPPIAQPREIKTADSFVGVDPETEAKSDQPEFAKRVTIPLTEEMHRRIKVWCASRGVNMADALREHMECGPWSADQQRAA